MQSSRTQNSIRNVFFTLASYLLILLIQLVNRTIFVKVLPVEYLGINGLFSNILSLLSLTELGIGTAITYSLYKPLAEHNTDVIKGIMNLYRKLYIIIGIIVFAVGSVLIPFLQYFIKEIPSFITLEKLRIYYFVYVINTSLSYFGTYKRTLLICDQKQYITSIVSSVCKFVLTVLQIISLLLFRDYLIYIAVMAITTVAENVCLTIIANNKYPYLKDKLASRLEPKIVGDIKRNVGAMMCHRIGDVVVNASDNIIITRFASLTLTGLYSNYLIIISALRTVINQIFTSVTASVGNLIADNNKDRDLVTFNHILFINFCIVSYCSLLLNILIDPFIEIWLGKDYTLSPITTVIICYSFYLTGMLKTVRIFRDAAGVFYYDRYKPIFESIINIITSIPLTIHYQIAGTIGGTIISCLSVSFWVEGYVLFHHHFNIGVVNYIKQQFKYFLVYTFGLLICRLIISHLSMLGILGWVCKLLISALIYGLLLLIIYRKSERFEYLSNLIKMIIGKNK